MHVIDIGQNYWLVDPVWIKNVSPMQWDLMSLNLAHPEIHPFPWSFTSEVTGCARHSTLGNYFEIMRKHGVNPWKYVKKYECHTKMIYLNDTHVTYCWVSKKVICGRIFWIHTFFSSRCGSKRLKIWQKRWQFIVEDQPTWHEYI